MATNPEELLRHTADPWHILLSQNLTALPGWSSLVAGGHRPGHQAGSSSGSLWDLPTVPLHAELRIRTGSLGGNSRFPVFKFKQETEWKRCQED